MRALMELARADGHEVSGSDAGFNGHCAENVQGAELVVYSLAVAPDNPEIEAARKAGIKLMSRAEFLAAVAQSYDKVIAVAGSHGKTTVTAMLGEIFAFSGATVHLGGTAVHPSFSAGDVLAHAADKNDFAVSGEENELSERSLGRRVIHNFYENNLSLFGEENVSEHYCGKEKEKIREENSIASKNKKREQNKNFAGAGDVPSHVGDEKGGAGKGKGVFITEACEYKRAFLCLKPHIGVILNTELDHTDCYASQADYDRAFAEFAANSRKVVFLLKARAENEFFCAVNSRSSRFSAAFLADNKKEWVAKPFAALFAVEDRALQIKKIPADNNKKSKQNLADKFGNNSEETSDALDNFEEKGGGGGDFCEDCEVFAAKNLENHGGKYGFELYRGGRREGRINLNCAGKHNVCNALAAAVASFAAGVDFGEIKRGLERFFGVKRRFEYLGRSKSGVAVITDYAHHPSEIAATIATAKDCGWKRVFVLFEPHTYTRTIAFMNGFAEALSRADRVGILPVFAARESGDNECARELARKTSALIKPDSLDNTCKAGTPLSHEANVTINNETGEPRKEDRREGDAGCEYFCDYASAQKAAAEYDGDVVIFAGAGSIDIAAREFAARFCE